MPGFSAIGAHENASLDAHDFARDLAAEGASRDENQRNDKHAQRHSTDVLHLIQDSALSKA